MAKEYYTANYSPTIEKYIEGILGRGNALVANTPYEEYQYSRVAPFNKAQKRYFEKALRMGVDPRSLRAADLTQEGIRRLYRQTYKPTKFDFGPGITAPQLRNYQMGKQRGLNAPKDWRNEIDPVRAAQGEYKDKLRKFNIEKIKDVKAREGLLKNYKRMQAAQGEFDANVRAGSFTTPGAADKYMSPYMQNVVDIQQREAQRQADIAAQARGAEAVQAGAFGGSRQAIMEAEAARNLAQQKGDIQAKGLQESFGQAQAQFNQEQQARLTAQQANQQARLQTMLSNLSNRQQANVQNLAADLQMRGMSAEQALRAALANQQTELQRRQSNQQGKLGVQQLESGYRQQMAMQNLANKQQAQILEATQRFESLGMTQQQAYDAAKTKFADRFAREQANLNAKLGVQQFGAGQEMTAQQFNKQLLMEQARMGEQSRQFGADFGYRGLMGGLQGAGQLGGQGQNIYGQNINNLNLIKGVGDQQQALNQRYQDIEYQKFLDRKRYPYQQIEWESALTRGYANPQAIQGMYSQQPPWYNQVMGAGATALGFGQQPQSPFSFALNAGGGNAAGGMISAGLMDLAVHKANS